MSRMNELIATVGIIKKESTLLVKENISLKERLKGLEEIEKENLQLNAENETLKLELEHLLSENLKLLDNININKNTEVTKQTVSKEKVAVPKQNSDNINIYKKYGFSKKEINRLKTIMKRVKD